MPSSISGMNVSGALMIFFIALSLLLYDNALIFREIGGISVLRYAAACKV